MPFDWTRYTSGNYLLILFGGSLFLAGLSAFYAIRQARHDLQRQSQWIKSVIGWFKSNSVFLLILCSLAFAIGAGLSLRKANNNASSTPTPAANGQTDGTGGTATATVTDTSQPVMTLVSVSRNEVIEPAQPLPTATDTPVLPEVALSAIKDGDCVNFDWNVIAQTSQIAVTFQDEPVQTQGQKQVCGTPEPYVLKVALPDQVSHQYTATVVSATPLPATSTPIAPYINMIEGTAAIPLFLNPVNGPWVADLVYGSYLSRLSITGQTSDGAWYRVCCFILPDQNEGPLWFRSNSGIIANKEAVGNLEVIVAPTVEALKNFERSRGPEFTTTSDENFLTIYAKVSDVSNVPLPGYYIAMEYKAKGQNDGSKRKNSRADPNGNYEVTSDAGYSISPFGEYNFKYEYKSPLGKLEEGNWEFWLTNAQETELSKREDLVIAANNPYRIVYIAWKLIR